MGTKSETAAPTDPEPPSPASGTPTAPERSATAGHAPNEGAKRRAHVIGLDVLGCIRSAQVPIQAAFLPLFEAVVNAIHATQDRFGEDVGKFGSVSVRIHRVQQQAIPSVGRTPVPYIERFEVRDNGAGFNDANLKSFETAFSTAKAERGGKGFGRFSWLVLCRQARIDSVYEDGARARHRRSFVFRPTTDGIEEFVEEEVPSSRELGTTVALESVHQRFAEALRKTTDFIVERLFEHCFDYLVVGNAPKLTLSDEFADGCTRVDVAEKIAELAIGDPLALDVGTHKLYVRHVEQPYRAERTHQARLCANQRVVLSFPLAQISDLGPEPLQRGSGRGPVVHHLFVSGKVLDDSVDASRTRLNIADDASLLAWSGELDMKTLRAALGKHVNERLAQELTAEREANLARVKAHIEETQPEYRHLLARRSEQLARLRWTDNATEMDEALYRVQQGWEAEVRKKQAAVEQKLNTDHVDADAIAEELSNVIEQVNEVGRSSLVRYVARRRAVLVFMRRLLAKKALEAHVHRIVFPLRSSTDEVDYDDHNLWLLDDTLAFYDFVASDLPLSENRIAPCDSPRRPDILAFKTGDPPYTHVAIVEFKRPERKDDNPVQQLVEYAVLLRDGKAKAADGTSIPGVPHGVRIDAYAVATLTAELEARVRTGPGNMQRVEGDWRWHGAVPAENLTIELLDFNVFVTRAEQRNRAFFNKLGLR